MSSRLDPEKLSSLPPENESGLTRRDVLASSAFVPLAALQTRALEAQTRPPAHALTAEQRSLLEAMINRLVPADENGPGATEMGASEYIDRALADAYANEKTAFFSGLEQTDKFSRAAHGKPFRELTPAIQDAVLTAMEAGQAQGFADARGFFNRLLRITQEGLFSDPYYGGNRNFAGWDLIGYPGPKLAVSLADQRMSVKPAPVRRSIYGGGNEHAH